MSLGEGFGGGFRGIGGGVVSLWEVRGKGQGVGRVGGWGGAGKGTGKSMHTCLSKLPFSNLPLSFSPIYVPFLLPI